MNYLLKAICSTLQHHPTLLLEYTENYQSIHTLTHNKTDTHTHTAQTNNITTHTQEHTIFWSPQNQDIKYISFLINSKSHFVLSLQNCDSVTIFINHLYVNTYIGAFAGNYTPSKIIIG